MPQHDIRLREELSDGQVLVIQGSPGIKGKTFSCYLVQVQWMEAPVYLVEDGTLDECNDAAANALRDDVLEVF
jgi:hypothetical protein